MLRYFLGRLGDGGGEPTLRVVRVGDKFRFADFLFIDVFKPTPDPGGGAVFLNIHAGFFTVVFFFPDIPYFIHRLFGKHWDKMLNRPQLSNPYQPVLPSQMTPRSHRSRT